MYAYVHARVDCGTTKNWCKSMCV